MHTLLLGTLPRLRPLVVCRDAAVSALLGELAGLLLDCGSHAAGELPGYVRAQALPQLSVAPALQVGRAV